MCHQLVNRFLSLFFLLFTCSLQAQEIQRWQGKITADRSDEPVSFATVAVYPAFKVFIADDLGQITLIYRLIDTIKVSCLGYYPVTILGQNLEKTTKITLQPAVYQLNEVKVSNKIRKEWWGNKSKRTRTSLTLSPGGKLALFVSNPTQAEGTITKLRYYLGNFMSDGYWVPFRIQLYTIGKNGKPGEAMLKEILMVQSDKRRWFEVDISQFQIAVPSEGFFVGMEFLTKEEYTYKTTKVSVKQSDGTYKKENQIIKVTIGMGLGDDGQEQTWINFGKDWVVHPAYSLFKSKSAMMGAEISF